MNMERLVKFRSSWRNKKNIGMNDSSNGDIDSVLENINLLLEDMTDTINNTSQEINQFTKHKSQEKRNEVIPLKERNMCERNLNSSKESNMYLSIPRIHCDFVNDINPTADICDSPPQCFKQQHKQHEENVQRAREAIELIKCLNNTKDDMVKTQLKNHSARLYNSAGNTPQDSPISSPRNSLIGSPRNSVVGNTKLLKNTSPRNSSVINKLNGKKLLVADNRIESDIRLHTISPRLDNANMEKYDVTITCPDDQVFKAGVFKSWTAFQLSWKIAHVKGMTEKLALNVQEFITDLHMYRNLEDHENVYEVITNWAPESSNTLKIVEDISKYDLFNEPADYLPLELLSTSNGKQTNEPTRSRRSSLFRSLTVSDVTPNMSGWIYVKDFDKKQWKKKYLHLKDNFIYISDNETNREEEAQKIYDCSSSFVYHCQPEFNKAHGTPSQFCFCVIPKVVKEWHEIKCFCTDSNRLLVGWISGFRLMKHGQQLYFNFREAMNKETNLRRTNSARQSLMYRRSFVEPCTNLTTTVDNKAPIDFSGNNGRIISDPHEVERIQHEIAFEIPKTVKRRSGAFSPASVRNNMLENKMWYHGKMDREQATQKLRKHSIKEGSFLVRESNSTHNSLVLTVVTKKGRIAHHQIFQSVSHAGVSLYGIEHGPQFMSLDLLIDSYHSGAVDGVDFSLRKPCP